MEQVSMNDGLDGRETIAFGPGRRRGGGARPGAAWPRTRCCAAASPARSPGCWPRSWPAAARCWPGAGSAGGRWWSGRSCWRGFLARTAPAAVRLRGAPAAPGAWALALPARAGQLRHGAAPRTSRPAATQSGRGGHPAGAAPARPAAAARSRGAVGLRARRAATWWGSSRSPAAPGAPPWRSRWRPSSPCAAGPRRRRVRGVARVVLLDLARRNPAVGLRLGLAPPTGTPRPGRARHRAPRRRGAGDVSSRRRATRRAVPRLEQRGARRAPTSWSSTSTATSARRAASSLAPLRPAAGDGHADPGRRARRLPQHRAAAPARPARAHRPRASTAGARVSSSARSWATSAPSSWRQSPRTAPSPRRRTSTGPPASTAAARSPPRWSGWRRAIEQAAGLRDGLGAPAWGSHAG